LFDSYEYLTDNIKTEAETVGDKKLIPKIRKEEEVEQPTEQSAVITDSGTYAIHTNVSLPEKNSEDSTEN
jgi:hypothetical protein